MHGLSRHRTPAPSATPPASAWTKARAAARSAHSPDRASRRAAWRSRRSRRRPPRRRPRPRTTPRRPDAPASPVLLVDPLAERFRADLAGALDVEPGALVLLSGLVLLLRLQLAVTLETLGAEGAGVHGRDDRAAGLGHVAAVAEAAASAKRFDVGKRSRDRLPGVPQLQFAHARRVDQDAAAREEHELAAGARMTAAVNARTHVARSEDLLADERVGERRLADARRAEERRCSAGTDVRPQPLDGIRPSRRHDLHGNAASDA